MTVEGKHRSLELAERHLRALAREHGGEWQIVSRTNASGNESAHGKFFTFERIEEGAEEPSVDELDEYLEQIADMEDEEIYYDEGESTADYTGKEA